MPCYADGSGTCAVAVILVSVLVLDSSLGIVPYAYDLMTKLQLSALVLKPTSLHVHSAAHAR